MDVGRKQIGVAIRDPDFDFTTDSNFGSII